MRHPKAKELARQLALVERRHSASRRMSALTPWAETLVSQPGFDIAHLAPADMGEAMTFNINDDIFGATIVPAATTGNLPLMTRDGGIADSGIVAVLW